MSGEQAIAVQSPEPPQPGGKRAGAHRGRSLLRRWVLLGIAILGFGLAALAVAVAIGAAAGVSATLLGLVVAIIPLGIVVPTFMWLDRFEAEPTRYLVMAFLWGALIAVLIAMTLNTAGQLVLWGSIPADESLALTAVFVAPVVEEAAKGLLILLVWRFARREFDGVTDGMVYAGVTAAGFAFTENIQYLALAWAEHGQDGLTATFIGRCLLSPFAHPMFTICTGIGIGIAATSRKGWVRWVAPLTGYAIAVIAHAVWNLAAVSGGKGLFAVYLVVEVPALPGLPRLRRLGPSPRGAPHRSVPPRVLRRRVALARGGLDARVDATPSRGTAVGPSQRWARRPALDGGLPGHGE